MCKKMWSRINPNVEKTTCFKQFFKLNFKLLKFKLNFKMQFKKITVS